MPQPLRQPRRERQPAAPATKKAHAEASWGEAVEGFLQTKRSDNVSSATIANYRWILLGPRVEELRKDHDIQRPADLSREALEGFQRELLDANLSSSTVHAFHRALKTFLGFCLDRGYSGDASVLNVHGPKLEQEDIEVFDAKDDQRLLDAARDPRDKLLVQFMLRTGLRLSEVCNVTLDDILNSPDGAYVRVRRGKGGKDRIVPLDTPGYSLSKEIERFRLHDRGKSQDPHLFLTRRRKGGSAGEFSALSPRAVQVLLRRLGDEAGVTANPHKFRHTFATRALTDGVDVIQLQRALGHTTLSMVTRYVHFRKDDILNAWKARRH